MSTPYDLDDDDANLPLGDEEVAQGPSPQKVESSQPEDPMAQELAPVRVSLETPVAALEEERREIEAQPFRPVHHVAAIDPREELQIQRESQQMEAQSFRERGERLKEIDRMLAQDQRQREQEERQVLKAQGLEFETLPDGSEELAQHADGTPRYKPAVLQPLVWEGRNPMREERDAWGKVTRSNLLEVGEPGKDYQRDDKSGEFYLDTEAGRQWLGKRDENFLLQRQYTQIRERAEADRSLQSAEAAEIRRRASSLQEQFGSEWKFEEGMAAQKQQAALQAAVNHALSLRKTAEAPRGLRSFLPGGQSREQKIEEADQRVASARTSLEAFKAKQEYDALLQREEALRAQVNRNRLRAAQMAQNLHAIKYGARPPFPVTDGDEEITPEREAGWGENVSQGWRIDAQTRYPGGMLEPAETPEGKPRVRYEGLLERAQALAEEHGATVSEMFAVAQDEARAQGLEVPEDPDRPFYRIRKDKTLAFDQNDPLAGVSQAVRDGVLPVKSALALIRKANRKPVDNQRGALTDAAARGLITTSNTVNRSLAGLFRFFGVDNKADYFAANQRTGEHDLQRERGGVTNRALDETLLAQGAEVAGSVAGMAPALAASGPMGAAAHAGRGFFAAARIGTLAPHLFGVAPMGVQAAADAYEGAWQGAKAEGKTDQEADGLASKAALDTLPALALETATGAAAARMLPPLTRAYPILETPWRKMAAAAAIETPLNLGASAAMRAAMGEEAMTGQEIATEIALTLLNQGGTQEAAKHLPTAREMANGTHPEVKLLRAMAVDSTLDQPIRTQAARQAEGLQHGGRVFLRELGANPRMSATVEHLDAVHTLKDLDAVEDSPASRDARAAATERANAALNQMVTQQEANGALIREIAPREAFPTIAKVLQHDRADPSGAVLAAIGQRAVENGTISPSMLERLDARLEKLPAEERSLVRNHAIGVALWGEAYPSVIRGNALEGGRLGSLQTLQEAGIVRIDPETGRSQLAGEFLFLIPTSSRERLMSREGDWMDGRELDVQAVAQLVREGHESGIRAEAPQAAPAQAEPAFVVSRGTDGNVNGADLNLKADATPEELTLLRQQIEKEVLPDALRQRLLSDLDVQPKEPEVQPLPKPQGKAFAPKAEATFQTLQDGGVSSVRKRETPEKHLSKGQVESVAARLTRRWPDPPKMEVIGNYEDLPETVREEYRAKGVVGFWKEGKVTIIAQKIASRREAARVILQEVAGQRGMRGVLGEKLYGRAMDRLALRHYQSVAEIAKSRALDMKAPEQRRAVMEEFLAKQAEPEQLRGMAEIMKQALQKAIPRLKVSDEEVRKMLATSRRFWRGEERFTKTTAEGTSDSTNKTAFPKGKKVEQRKAQEIMTGR